MGRPTALILMLLWCLSNPCKGQPALNGQAVSNVERQASDSHSFTELFTTLERNWIQAVQGKDESALDAILAPEFIVRTSWNPENPVPRSAWMKHALIDNHISTVSQRTMAIRAFMGVAVVSYVESQQEPTSSKRNICYFVVDLWEVNHERWQAAARFITQAGESSCQGQ